MTGPRTAWRLDPTRPLVLVLLLMLGLSGFLAYQAWDAARSHRQVTEAALSDYAGFAAWELRRRVEAQANSALNTALMPARFRMRLRLAGAEAPAELDLPGFVVAARSALHFCACAEGISDFFTVDLESGQLRLAEATRGPEFHDWLATEFVERVRTSDEPAPSEPIVRRQTERGGLVIVQRATPPEDIVLANLPIPLDSSRVVIYASNRGPGSQRVYGFVVDVAEFVRPLIRDAFSSPSLLPLALTGSVSNEEMLAATVWSASGDTIFQAGGEFTSRAEVIDTFRLATGALAARVAVRPQIAEQLVIGGLPRSRVPVLLGSVGLTLALLLIAVVQLRRQHELFRLRADFIAGVSHELRTPLAQIRLFADLLDSGRLEEPQRRRSIRIVSEESKRLTYLVENVLRFSRSEREMERITPAELDAGTLLREIVQSFAPLARSREAHLVVDAPDGMSARLDADAMRQALLNVLDNAVKYGPRGQRIDVRARRDGEWLRIEVEDEGPGIPEPDRERIWEPYRRLSRGVEAATGGSGIGLAVVRELVTLHGGQAFVTDGARGGSRFVLRLPCAGSVGETRDEAGRLEPRVAAV